MAHIRRHKKGYRAEIYSHGKRTSKVLRTRSEALAWAQAQSEAITRERDLPPEARKTFGDLLAEYAARVLPGRRGEQFERHRIHALLRDYPALAGTMLCDLTPERLADYRDSRLARVKPGSVIRELTILGSALEHGRREWRWIRENPMRDVRKPSQPAHRERTLTWGEMRAILKTAGYRRARECRSATEATARAMLLAVRTGMRAGELCALTWADVQPDYVILHRSKIGEGRHVPLSRQAARVLVGLRGWDSGSVLGLERQTLDSLFRKLRIRAGLSGFTFHDTRHTAATMLARKLDVLTLCKVFGWKNTKRALTYFNPSASEIARRLQ